MRQEAKLRYAREWLLPPLPPDMPSSRKCFAMVTSHHSVLFICHLLHVYLHREPHCSGPFDMQLVYEDMPQESGSYQCKRMSKRR